MDVLVQFPCLPTWKITLKTFIESHQKLFVLIGVGARTPAFLIIAITKSTGIERSRFASKRSRPRS
jgi:hypothetical protein